MAGNTAPNIKPGFIIALVLIGLTLFFYFTGIKTGNQLQMLLRVLVVVAGVAISAYLFAKKHDGLTGKDIFFYGFRVTAIVALCTIAFGVLFVLLVPQFKEDAVIAFKKDQLSSPEMTPAKLAEEITAYKKRFLTLFIGMNMMIVVLSGFVGALAGTLISPKKQ